MDSRSESDTSTMSRWYWKRLQPIELLFALGIVSALVDWQLHAPTPAIWGESTAMRNVPGDLQSVLQLYLIEFLLACVALQPGRASPRRTPMVLAALGFLGWGVLRLLVGLHSPTVMLGHDLLMFAVALALARYALRYRRTREEMAETL